MNLRTAYTLNPNRANKLQLELAIQEMKRQYVISSKALQRRGETSEVMKTVGERIDHNPDLYSKKVSQLTLNEAKEVFTTYRDYHAHRTYDKTSGKFKGYEENVTRTLTGYQDYIKKVGSDVLNYDDYSKLPQDLRTELWNIIKNVRKSPDARDLFLSRKVEANVLYQSGRNIKEVMNFIKAGITDPVEIVKRLREGVEKEILNAPPDTELEIPFFKR